MSVTVAVPTDPVIPRLLAVKLKLTELAHAAGRNVRNRPTMQVAKTRLRTQTRISPTSLERHNDRLRLLQVALQTVHNSASVEVRLNKRLYLAGDAAYWRD